MIVLRPNSLRLILPLALLLAWAGAARAQVDPVGSAGFAVQEDPAGIVVPNGPAGAAGFAVHGDPAGGAGFAVPQDPPNGAGFFLPQNPAADASQIDPSAGAGSAVPRDPAAGQATVASEDPSVAVASPQKTVVLGAGSKKEAPGSPAVAAPADAAAGTAENGSAIQTLGEGDQKIFLVDHKGTWSMHVENVITSNIVLLWKQGGGPEVTMKMLVDRPFTMSVHRLAPELILERLFEGYGYTLHYDDAGRLTSVRVYSPRDSLAFKTPRLTESLSDWKKAETEPEAPAGPS